MPKKSKIVDFGFDAVFIKFILVGALNTLLAYLFFAAFLFGGINYLISTFLAGVATVVSGFYLHKSFVFNVSKASFFKFTMLFVLIYVLNISIQTGLLGLEINKYLAGFVATFLCAIVSFLVLRSMVFRE